MSFTETEQNTLRQVAIDAISYALETGKSFTLDPQTYPEKLQEIKACFVTLNKDKALRGCIGSLTAHRPLVADIAANAQAAAFSDPRFPPLTAMEWPNLSLHLSVLSTPKAMHFKDEADLITQLRPGIDGLILNVAGHRGTFLPAVWEILPDPVLFLAQLKQKAGLPSNFWSDDVEIFRYQTEMF
ncbi:AmmeMemoRadiSam system protein A [Candidatus Venteria ishoeyi]|uniref:AMMECR1 domain-containing protein n=1 Tax=Candidatus Venteria ishoeyi TaxID=1899563 RepID=A0A1H6F8W3_9GAMM|nr:AmmeMemoRadiSam system protein A [Candidatus Venteria ishoeyi]MDM8547006.1 AmmeMemoRadiSam system protein A [Candidatus Venteria ishoeyi]SEH06568.1 Uncharacterised protein [Candidatus Venteria ishoeyi]